MERQIVFYLPSLSSIDITLQNITFHITEAGSANDTIINTIGDNFVPQQGGFFCRVVGGERKTICALLHELAKLYYHFTSILVSDPCILFFSVRLRTPLKK